MRAGKAGLYITVVWGEAVGLWVCGGCTCSRGRVGCSFYQRACVNTGTSCGMCILYVGKQWKNIQM